MERLTRTPGQLAQAARLVWQAGPGYVIAGMLLTVVQSVLPLAQLYLMKLIVDAISDGVGAADRSAALAHVLWLVGAAALVAVVSQALSAASEYLTQAQGRHFTDHMQSVVHAKSVAVDLAYYESPHYYDTLHRAQAEARYRPLQVVNRLTELVRSGLSGIAVIGLLVGLHWAIPFALLAAALPVAWVRLRYARNLYDWQRRRTSAHRSAAYLDWILTGSLFAKEVRLFSLGDFFRKRYDVARDDLRGQELTIERRRSAASAAAQSAGLVAMLAALAYMAVRALDGAISIGDVVMYYQAFQRGQGYLASLLRSLAGVQEDNLFLTNLFEFLSLDPEITEPEDPRELPEGLGQGISFEGVRFRYPTGTRDVLRGVDLEIRPGEVVALVGENGSGKTTLVKLLCRLYDPSEGRIALDGEDLREYSPSAVRGQMGVIFQDFARYELTARENIAVGDADRAVADGEVEEAAREAGAEEFIARLPEGYETVLGKRFEHGHEPSEGQWQKLALARALLRDSRLVILDEPTSAMDARAEAETFEAFSELMRGRSAVVISHRFSTVRAADRIYVLDSGVVAESGTHDELMELDGIYAGMYRTQAKHYQ